DVCSSDLGDEIGGVPISLRNAEHVSDNGQAGGGPALQEGKGARRERRCRNGAESCVQRSSRRSGRVMQRGPPPPRTSSLPSIEITARSVSATVSSPVSSFTAETSRKPALVSSSSVASLR